MDPTISGPAVRAAREAAKLSQNAVAQALGINRMYYSLFEAGRYVLNDSEQKALREFLASRELHLVDNYTDAPSKSPQSESDTPTADRDQENARTREAETRTDAARAALRAVQVTVQEAFLASKRTAAAVAVASAALQALDFAELLTLAEGVSGMAEGLPEASTFAELPLEDKQLWESRAAGMLVCGALYGDAWQAAPCEDLSRAAKSIRKTVDNRQWDVTDLDSWGWGFFKDHEKHRLEYRCQLARHIAKAAEQRRAPTLTPTQPTGSIWDW